MFDNFLIILFLLFPLLDVVRWQPSGSAHILLTEVYYNTTGKDSENEWIELANLGDQTIDISEYKVGDEESIWGGEGMFRFPEGSIIAPGEVVVIAQSAIGFRALYGRDPDYEILDSIPQVPNMQRYSLWSSGELALANDGDELLILDGQNQIVDTINYGDKKTYFSPSIGDVFTGQSIERIPASCDTDLAADWQPQRYPTPGRIQIEGECSLVSESENSTQDLLPIGIIQGEGDVSPYVNQNVEFRGIVTGTLEDQNADGIVFYTLFVQDVLGDEDGNPATSDGIAVFLGRKELEYQPGDIVLVKGKVTEFFGLTEIDDDELEISSSAREHALPDSRVLVPPDDLALRQGYFEAFEGMLVAVPGAAKVVGPTHTGCGFAVMQSNRVNPLLPLRQRQDFPGLELPILNNSDVDCEDIPQLKTGDRISGVSGPLTYHFDLFKIVEQDMNSLEVSPSEWVDIPAIKPLFDNQISIASFNLENFFDGKRDSKNIAEPLFGEEELAVKRAKLAHTITNSLACPTIVAVQEVENAALLQELVQETTDICGFRYQISHSESSDSRGLDVALLSDPHRVNVVSTILRQSCTDLITGVEDKNLKCPNEQSPLFGRPPLQVDLSIDGYPYVFFVNHFKSKRGAQAQTEERRIQQAAVVHDFVRKILKEDDQAKVIVLGDLNDFEKSPALMQLTKDHTLYNALQNVPLTERYTYIFDGRTQLIDHILITNAIRPQIDTAAILHINADFPVGLAGDLSAEGLSYRVSDHDIPMIILNLSNEERNETMPETLPAPTIQISSRHYPVPANSEKITDPEKTTELQINLFQPNPWFAIGLVLLIIGTLLLIFKFSTR